LSDGVVIPNPRFFRTDALKLRRAAKSVSRKQRDSRNRAKAARRLARIHLDISNRRKDFIHKFTTDLVKTHDQIVLEDLAVGAMSRSLRLGKSVADAAMAETRRQLTYKASWYGTALTVVDRWYPSSRTCSKCGLVNPDLKLSDRSWICPCGESHDRDVNAAVNLKSQAVSSTVTACGVRSAGSPFSMNETTHDEAGTEYENLVLG
jgi:putative transposase